MKNGDGLRRILGIIAILALILVMIMPLILK